MTYLLPCDIIELVPRPAAANLPPGAPLREMAFRDDSWLPEEIDALRSGFAADQDLQEIAFRLDRTLAAVRTRVDALGLRRNSSRPWTALEDELLSERYGSLAASAIAGLIGRSPSAIYARAGFLGLTEANPPAYTPWEIAQIRAGYTQGVSVAQLGVLIGRPVCGIATIASRLKIRHANAAADWSDAEQHRALELAETGLHCVQVAARLSAEGFPERSGRTVGQTLRRLGYGRGWGRPWLAEEDDLLRQAYAQNLSLTPLRQRLGRTSQSLRWRAKELGLQGTHAKPHGWRLEPAWTAEEIATLRRDYGRVPTQALADALGRKKAGVYNKAFSLGLVHGWMRAFTNDEERAISMARAGTISLTDLSEALGRDAAVVSKHAIRMGIPFANRPHKVSREPRRSRTGWTLKQILALDHSAVSPT